MSNCKYAHTLPNSSNGHGDHHQTLPAEKDEVYNGRGRSPRKLRAASAENSPSVFESEAKRKNPTPARVRLLGKLAEGPAGSPPLVGWGPQMTLCCLTVQGTVLLPQC